MNHTKARALWANDTDLLYTEVAHIDANAADAISGQSGAYSLTENLTIGGAPGLYFSVLTNADFEANLLVFGTLGAF